MACFAAHLSSIPRLWARPVSAVLRVEIDLVHGLSTSRPSAERDTQGRSLPVGSSAGSSFLIHGSENSRPSCMRSPLILLPPEAAGARRLRSTIQASPVPARRPADRRRDLQTVRHATACPMVPQRDACGDTPPQIAPQTRLAAWPPSNRTSEASPAGQQNVALHTSSMRFCRRREIRGSYAPTVEGKDGVQGPRPIAQTLNTLS